MTVEIKKNEEEGGKVGKKKINKRWGKEKTDTDWKGRRERMRNNIHKIINMCLTQEQSIGSINFVSFRMTVVRGNYQRGFCYLLGNWKRNRSTQNIILW